MATTIDLQERHATDLKDREADGVELLRQLVRIPSPNPPGDTRAMAHFVARHMRNLGCEVHTVAPAEKPEALNAIASLGEGEPVIMLHAHIDTVPIARNEADKWSVEPYAGVVQDGALYGKGSIDDKAPLASMMLAMADAARQDALRGRLVLVAAAEEEVGGQLGTKWLADHGHLPACDFIIVGEQTGNRVATAHKGVMRATVHTSGRAVHATNPDRGINAIVAMARVVEALHAYHQRLAARTHPVVGSPTCNIGVIEGGSTANAVPDACHVMLDRRMIPREVPQAVQSELYEVINAVDVAPAGVSMDGFVYSPWFDSALDSTAGQTFLSCVRAEIGEDAGPVGYLPGSDAKHLTGLARGDMIIFGPGSYEAAHGADEHVMLSEYRSTTKILLDFLRQTLYPGH